MDTHDHNAFSATVLVIDDSATIRKLVDSHLSQEGYRVLLAPTAEIGLELARQGRPDLILLDHQLPGTTGIEICRKIIEFPECTAIPFVISSTLRKQAYVEYMEIPNVVDSLHKPFQPELLKMTVANALETGAMIVSSQSSGTAVPEVLGDADKAALSGDFSFFSLRELIDFLNNGNKSGMLEVETIHDRIWFYLNGGRIQCVVSASVDERLVARTLPDGLKELAPLLRFTMSTGFSAHADGIVELLDRKVLDPRMLRTLLRHQAAVLTWHGFNSELKTFNFTAERPVPPLFRRTPLETSLAALLIDGTVACADAPLEKTTETTGWIRQGLRGQNLDRAGMSARHVQLLSGLDSVPVTATTLAEKTGVPPAEVVHVLEGLRMADWVRTEAITAKRQLLALEPDLTGANQLRAFLSENDAQWGGRVVRDQFGLKLLLKRMQPDVVMIAADDSSPLQVPESLREDAKSGRLGKVCLIAPEGLEADDTDEYSVLTRPYSNADILTLLERSTNEAALQPEVAK